MLQRFAALAALVICAFALPASAQAPNAAQRAQAREIYERIVSFDTSSGAQNVAMANYLAQRFRAGGFAADDVRVIPHGETAGLLVRYRGTGAARPILLLAHMDVVPARREEWERDPFRLIEEGGFFYGRGTLDNKAGIAHITSTLLTLRAENFRPTRDLIVWFSGDEETTGATTQALLTQHRELLSNAEFALNSDAGGGSLDPSGAALGYGMQTAEKTYASFTFTVRNPGGHSSAPRADNAIYELSEALTRLRAFQFPVMWNETTLASFASMATVTPEPTRSALRRFVERPGDRRAAAALSQNPHLAALIRTTCVATMLDAGHAENALAQTARATVNCRIFPGVAVADVQAELQAIAGTGVEVAPHGPSSATDASPLRPDVIEAVSRAVQAVHANVPVAPYMSAGATDGLYFRAAGIPTYGAGGIFMREQDMFAHGLNERVPVESFYAGLTHWRVLITELAGPR